MLVVRLKQAIEDYRQRTGRQMSVAQLARRLHMSPSALWTIARPRGSTTLRTIEKIARALDMKALDLLDEVSDEAERQELAGKRPPRRSRQPAKPARRGG